MDSPAKRLQHARERAGYSSAAEAADKFGWTYPTYAAHENGGRGLRIESARKYARAFKVSLSWLLSGQEAAPEPELLMTTALPLRGDVAAGVWREADEHEMAHEPMEIPAVPDRRYPPQHQFARRVLGTSMNKVVQPGEYIICISLEHSHYPEDGQIVVCKRTRAGLEERTLKRYRVNGGAPTLVPESSDPAHQKPLELGADEAGTIVEIDALVVGAFRRF